MVNYPPKKMIAIALLVVLIMVLSSAFAGGNMLSTRTMTTSNAIPNSNSIKYNIVSQQLDKEKFSIVPTSPSSVDSSISTAFNGSVSVIVTFSFNNQSRLNSLLSNLSNPESSGYHKFMTRSQFTDNFSVSQSVYSQAVSYLSQYSGISVKTYEDRVSIQVTGPAGKIGDLLNTSIVTNSNNRSRYFAAAAPELPSSLATYVSQVTGLSNAPAPIQYNMETGGQALPKGAVTSVDGGYPSPSINGGTQYIYGSDLQVAYDEQSLLNITYPTNEVIATILWAGTNSSGAPVGAFDPSDIYSYYNSTLPPYEPHPNVHGVPINGAISPGISAGNDTTGASTENTLDLEMVGSTAPGASIYNVYGPNSSYENLDSALAFILNPNSTYSALNNVTVITNSWGGPEYNNTVWYQYLQEAQARGITVLASSGDSGDNNFSSKYISNPYYPGDYVQFPASMAYNNFGITSVGGTTLTLSTDLHIVNQTAWYESNISTGGNPAGSAGGISEVFGEPSWQLNTEANLILSGNGLGVPDISAIGNNTIIYQTVGGTSNAFSIGGTSVASPVEAGIVAEIDAVLNHYNQSNLGYLNPIIYSLANKQVTPMEITSDTGYISTGSYNSTLPTLPFYNVMYGRNHVYNATFGYNLVTGWGSIDAYNFTMYILNINRSLSPIGLKGVDDILALNNLNVTSYEYNSTTQTYSINTFYNASIQQNIFLANQFGAPIYWIQNVVYINGSQATGWVVNYTGWVVYPFYGQYPSQTVYEYNFPLGKTIFMPHTFNVRTWITNISKPMQQTVNFEVNSHIVTLPVPGAAYIIDAHNYSYAWQGHTYYNGPSPDNPYYGGLNPQFGLVGGPSLGIGDFGNSTSGSIAAYVEPLDLNSYLPAVTKVFNQSIDETGETAYFLNFTSANESSWTISVNNDSLSQGIVDYGPASAQYDQIFQENLLPSGTSWSVNIGGSEYSSTSDQIIVPLINGSYAAEFSSPTGFFPSPLKYVFTVNGDIQSFNVTYSYSSNKTYINPISTIYPLSNQVFSGSTVNTSYLSSNVVSLGMAYDSSTGLLFIPLITRFATSYLFSYNTTTGRFVNTLSGAYYDALFDNATGFVYAISFNGNLSEINPSTMTIVKNVTIPGSVGNETLLHQQGQSVYAFSDNGNLSQINPLTMAVVNTVVIGPVSDISPFFTIYEGNAFFANSTGNDLLIVNLTNFALRDLSLPSQYDPQSVVPYYGPELLIGGSDYSNELYNVSTGSLVAGPYISGTVTSSIYNLITHEVYIFSEYGEAGNITVVSQNGGKILASIPGEFIQLSPAFDSFNQNIYVDDVFGAVSEFSIQHYYSTVFTESDLPPGTAWYVNMTGGEDSGKISGSSYTFSLINGTYPFTISTSNKLYHPSPSSGSLTVNGAAVSEPITFSKVTYKTTFTESGLPSGVEWYVNGSGVSEHELAPANITFNLSNGTYSFTATNLSDYYTTRMHISVLISGNNVTETVYYYHWAYITGKVSPANSTVTINGKTVSVSSGSFNVSVADGTYRVTASSPGYTSYYNNFTLNSGNIKNLTINLKPILRPSTISSTELYAIAGAVIVIVAMIGVIFTIRRKRG